MEPTVGCVVDFVAEDSEVRAAIITEVAPYEFVSLTVFEPQGVRFLRDVPFGRRNTPRSWHWRKCCA